jgi:hypothetical protein
MEHQEFTCDACGNDQGQSYRLRAYRHVGSKVITDFRYSFCQDCAESIRPTVRRALTQAFMHMLQEELGKFKQELQATGSKIGKHL